MRKNRRSLYQCSHAVVKYGTVCCSVGYNLKAVNIRQLIRGDPLESDVCQDCSDYDCMGPPVPKDERGWLQMSHPPFPRL